MAPRRTDLVKAGAPATLPEPDGPPARPEDVLALPPDARDISAELAAPPRRRLPWGTLLLAGCVVAALGFTGGVLVGKDRTGTGTGGGFAARTGSGGGFAARAGGGAGAPGGAGGAFGGRGTGAGTGAAGGLTVGTIKLVDGSTVYLTDPQGGIVKVTTGKATTVSESKKGKVSDLRPGQTVTVRGTADSSGNVAADTVTEGGTAGGFGGRGAP